MSTTAISEGRTNSLIIPSILLLLTGAIVCVFFTIPGIILIVLALSLFTTTSGFELDPTNRKYRSYRRLYGISWGLWKSLETADHIEIWLSSESRTIRSLYPASASTTQGGRVVMKSITYDLVLYLTNDQKKIAFEFMSYKKALAALRAVEEQLQLPVRDRVAEKLAENQLRRGRR